MHWKLIYPRWRKLARQTPFNLPPHGPVVFAATLPPRVRLEFVDENVQPLALDDAPQVVALSVMLTAQLPRALEIARHYRARGIPVIAGGIAIMLHAAELAGRFDSLFLGEAEGRMEQVVADFERGTPAPVYDFLRQPPPIEQVGTARREILERERYVYRGVRMLDLVHASRGCHFDCFPCCTGYLGGRLFRPRPLERVIEEVASIDNNRLFFVDNSLAQDHQWEEALFRELAPLKKKWVSHPIENDDRLLQLAYDAGCWYVYQAIFDTSDVIRQRVRAYHDHGIRVEGTILLGTDDQDEDSIKRLIDFLLEIELDIAEFTILTPFPQTPIRRQLEAQGRLLRPESGDDWGEYTCDRVLFQPRQMAPERLQAMFDYAWDTFYRESGQELRMGELFRRVIARELADGTYQRPARAARKG